jgi:N-methylhydantoinase B
VDETASTVLADRGRSGPPGADGGLPAATTEVVWNLAGEEFRPPHITKASGVVMQQGDVLRVRTPGGGGYGDPRLRDRAAVRSDVDNGYLDQDQANEIYGPTESAERTS